MSGEPSKCSSATCTCTAKRWCSVWMNEKDWPTSSWRSISAVQRRFVNQLNLVLAFCIAAFSNSSIGIGSRSAFTSPTASPNERTRTDDSSGTTVKFGQPFNGIVCASRDLDLPIPSSDSTMARYVQDYLDTLASRPRPTMSTAIRDCIYVMLPSGLCSAEHVARRLGIDRRTVHRQLSKEGELFSSLLDSVRTELVTRYVENRERRLSDVAELLGFSGLSSFSRWYRNKFECSVSQWRNERPRDV